MHKRRELIAMFGATLAGCSGNSGDEITSVPPEVTNTDLALTSPAFDDGGTIPVKYTCEGDDINPVLSIANVPATATSLALIVDDPDAPRDQPFVHWLMWNLPPDTETIPQAVPQTKTADSLDARQGTNSGGNVGYMGPCPPTDDGAHTYRFMLHALGTELTLEAGAKRPALGDAMQGHLIARTTLRGKFNRG